MTMRKLETDLAQTRQTVAEARTAANAAAAAAAETREMVKKLLPNGHDTNEPGDLQYRIAEKLGVVVDELPAK